jgi:hypothetical protein
MGQPLQQHLVGELEKLQKEEEELRQISPDALKEQLDAYTVVDVRCVCARSSEGRWTHTHTHTQGSTPHRGPTYVGGGRPCREREEYEREHVAGSINLPLGRLLSMAATDLAGLLALLPRQQVVVYCRQGHRGALAQKELHTVHTSLPPPPPPPPPPWLLAVFGGPLTLAWVPFALFRGPSLESPASSTICRAAGRGGTPRLRDASGVGCAHRLCCSTSAQPILRRRQPRCGTSGRREEIEI